MTIAGAFLTVISCRKPYLPPVVATSNNYLVVEGVINPGHDSTIIRLSRTVSLSSTIGTKPELNATVVVESNTHTTYPLQEKGNGYYVSPGLNLNASNQYHLKITTTGNKVYQSDFVPVKNSPPIDSVYYRAQSNGLQIYADTHDPSNSTRYYRWDFSETYIVHSLYISHEILVQNPKDTIVPRPVNDLVYECWVTDVSNNINLNSSAKLSNDVIAKNSVNFLPSTSEKLADRYSILVKQYALTTEAYDYWTQLKKNTEQLGSVFDAQPSEIAGNIHCVTVPSEPVLGFISVGSYSQSRIFIDNASLPAWLAVRPYYDGCILNKFYYKDPTQDSTNTVATNIFGLGYTPVDPLSPPQSSVILGFTASTPQCVDCTLRGTNKEPAFWVER
ncbi:MAG TPA: DUF4249 domain-containing protein [Mucilaginibacter sp.]|jgi:hypothetical protein